jgi:hypothetical protein
MKGTPIHVSKRCGAPNVTVPDAQPSVNYKDFKEAYNATQARRAAAGKLVLPTSMRPRVK